MDARNADDNKNVKHKLDELYKIWLGKGELFQQNDPTESYDMGAIKRLLAEDDTTQEQTEC